MTEMTLEQEQAAFDKQLPEILDAHRGEYAVMKGGHVEGYFATHNQAYEAALDRFGIDGTFLIAKVDNVMPGSVSVAWEAGVMFAE